VCIKTTTYFFPGLGAVGFASAVHSSLVLSKMHQCDGQTSKVGHVVVQQLSSVVHFVVKASISHLQHNIITASHILTISILTLAVA